MQILRNSLNHAYYSVCLVALNTHIHLLWDESVCTWKQSSRDTHTKYKWIFATLNFSEKNRNNNKNGALLFSPAVQSAQQSCNCYIHSLAHRCFQHCSYSQAFAYWLRVVYKNHPRYCSFQRAKKSHFMLIIKRFSNFFRFFPQIGQISIFCFRFFHSALLFFRVIFCFWNYVVIFDLRARERDRDASVKTVEKR